MLESGEEQTSRELSAVLDALRSEGELNSSGVFTVDLTRALPKLEKFQLPKPHFGLLKLVQSAVVFGATRLKASFDASEIRIEHNGEVPNSQELRGILNFLMAPDLPTHQRALRDLAIGINTTLARGARWVEVRVRDGNEWVSQRWLSRQDSEQTVVEHRGSEDMTFSFVMRRTTGQSASHVWKTANKDVMGMFRGDRGTLDEDAQVIFDRCRHAGISIEIGRHQLPDSSFGKRISRRWSPFSHRFHQAGNLVDIAFASDQASPHLLTPPSQCTAALRYVVSGTLEGGRYQATGRPKIVSDFSSVRRRCFAMVGIRPSATVPCSVTLVKDGVDLTTLSPETVPKGVKVLLCAEGLKLDLSHFRLIQGPEIQERTRWLGDALGRSLTEILEEKHIDDFSEDEQRHLRALATYSRD